MKTPDYHSIYKDDLCELFLGMESFGLSFHAKFERVPTLSDIKHYHEVFDAACAQIRAKGFESIYTTVADYEQYNFAERFGFKNEKIIMEDEAGNEYQLLMKPL